MSYILDSLKRSDKERRSIDTPSAMVMSAPAFLDNDQPKSNAKLIVISCMVLLLSIGIYFLILYSDQLSQLIGKDQSLATNDRALVTPESRSASSLNKEILVDKSSLSQEKEQAILLYQQALSNKSKPEIDSLYQELNDKSLNASSPTLASGAEATSVENANNASGPQLVSALETRIATSDSTELADATVEAPVAEFPAVRIPSIYQLDAYVRKDIPSVDYGAHIYATDNNSGFVILDGARRRAGDKLDSGLFVEKIEEESVVLSFNGTLFSLPAMKSWEGK